MIPGIVSGTFMVGIKYVSIVNYNSTLDPANHAVIFTRPLMLVILFATETSPSWAFQFLFFFFLSTAQGCRCQYRREIWTSKFRICSPVRDLIKQHSYTYTLWLISILFLILLTILWYGFSHIQIFFNKDRRCIYFVIIL